MPCNPNVGGSSKGHLVRELDALGGEMGKNIDKTFIQSKMLNESKGPAVHSLRAQADKQEYSRQMRKTMENTEHLTIRPRAEVSELIVEDGQIKCADLLRGHISRESSCTVYRNLSTCKMYLQGRKATPTRTKRTAGSYPFDGLPDRKRN